VSLDPQDLFDKVVEPLLALLQDPARCKTLRSNARQLIRAQYTWEHAGKKLRSVLEAMCEFPRMPQPLEPCLNV
jgi:glycosyltransferase involved in cell wall biosynthesis